MLLKRYLGSLKKYVRNRARPEGSIVEGYIANDCLTSVAEPEKNLSGGKNNTKIFYLLFF